VACYGSCAALCWRGRSVDCVLVCRLHVLRYAPDRARDHVGCLPKFFGCLTWLIGGNRGGLQRRAPSTCAAALPWSCVRSPRSVVCICSSFGWLLLIHVEKCMLLQTCPAHCFFFSALNTGPPKQSSTTIASTSATPARLVWVDTKATSYNIRRRGGGQAARDFSGEVESSLLFTIETLAFDSLFPLLIFCGWPAAFNVCFCASVIACLRSLLFNMNF